MKLIVGLGNPEKKYDSTRHNVGFMVLDNYLQNETWQKKFNALFCKKNIENEIVYFIKPLTYMNLSGQAVREYMNFFNINIDDILIIQDDLDEELGKYKLKKNSSSGGHNGIKSIIECLGTNAFSRLKIGIKNAEIHDPVDFVLGKFSSEELDLFNSNTVIYNQILETFIVYGIEKAMNMYNKK